MFHCDMCGQCCRNLSKSDLYAFLNRGDGICKYLKGNLCSIYKNRPLLCRVDESYYAYFQDKYTIDEYYRINYEGCIKLKNNHQL